MKAWTVACAEPGCAMTVPTTVEDLRWTCPPHSIACWPDSDRPCADDADCGRSCYLDGGSWVYEGQRGDGDAAEDVQFLCQCEHHHGPSAGARWAEALRGADAMRSHSANAIRLWA